MTAHGSGVGPIPPTGCDAREVLLWIPVARRLKHAGKVCVCALVPLFDLAQPTISHHLKVLKQAGLIESEKHGLWAYYYVQDGALDELAGWLHS